MIIVMKILTITSITIKPTSTATPAIKETNNAKPKHHQQNTSPNQSEKIKNK